MLERMSFDEFKRKYQNHRNTVYKDVPFALGLHGVRLTPITSVALSAKQKWPDAGRRPPNGGWDWQSWVTHFKSGNKKFFDVAVWHGNTLCGLGLGALSHRNVRVRLEIIEGSSDDFHPLKGRIALIVLTALETFGYMVGAEESLIMDPVDDAIQAYTPLGYVLKQGGKRVGRYMSKQLV